MLFFHRFYIFADFDVIYSSEPNLRGNYIDTAKNIYTLTSHSSILWVTSVAVDNRATGAVGEVTLTTTAFNIIQIDWTNTSTKVSIAKWYCTYLVCEHTKFTVN